VKAVLIVEGTKDADQIKKAFEGVEYQSDVRTLVTEGTKVNNRILAEIEDCIRDGYNPYILSDPDEAGGHLADMIQNWFPDIPRLEVDEKECAYWTGKKFKSGIEYASYDYLIQLISPYIDAEYVLDEMRELHGLCNPIKYKIDTNGCWICTSHQFDKDGYPRLVRDKKKVMASRYVFELYKEQIDKGNVILHSCDNPNCINPKHLSQGTHKQNSEDRNNKKRQAYGVRNGNVKLTEEKVLEIKALLANKVNQKEIARIYDVSHVLIEKISQGKLWKHVKID
jgi:5S rRNA maturation endonuclease (ribonuclease M5)